LVGIMTRENVINGQNGTDSFCNVEAVSPLGIGEEDEHTTEKTITFEDGILYGDKGDAKGINHDTTARWVTQEYDIAHLIETNNTLIYQEGVYKDFAEAHLMKLLYDAAEHIKRSNGSSLIRNSDIAEVVSRIRHWSLKSISEFECERRRVYNVANGVINLDTYELMPHSPEYRILSKSPAVYDPDADCPKFREFMDQSLDKRYHDFIGEFIGYVFWPQYHIHKASMFLGPQRAGKGTMMRVIEALVGKDSCAHVSLQDLLEHRFMRARLFGKKLNSYGDLPATALRDAGIFKNVTGEDTIDAENKYEHPFSFNNTAKLLFSANSLPKLVNPDQAFYGRWVIVPFENSCYGNEDSKLTEKLTTPEELSGVLNLGLEGLKRLKMNGWKFTYADDAASIYRKQSNPLFGFLEDRCEASSESYIVKADFVAAYNEYANENGFPPAPSKKAIGSQMEDQTIIPVDTYYPAVNGRQAEAWRGIKLRE